MRHRLLSFIGVCAAVTLALETIVRVGWLNPLYFPPPSVVAAELLALSGTQAFWHAVAVTIMGTAAGFVLAAAVAVPIGTAMGQSSTVRLLLEPVVDSLRPMPSAAVIPVAILLLGLGLKMRVAVVVFGSVWPIIINTMDGVRGVDTLLIDTGRLLQFKGTTLLRKVVLPAALPAIFTGLRVSLGIALILTVTAEMIAGTDGLGYFILDAQRSFAFPTMFAAIVALALLGALVTQVFGVVERRALFWHVSVRRDATATGSAATHAMNATLARDPAGRA